MFVPYKYTSQTVNNSFSISLTTSQTHMDLILIVFISCNVFTDCYEVFVFLKKLHEMLRCFQMYILKGQMFLDVHIKRSFH